MVELVLSLLRSECWTLRTRRDLRARVEIFKPGGQRSAVHCCQAQTEVDQSLSGRFIYLLMRKCGRVPFSSPFSLSLLIYSASVSQIFCLSVIVNRRCKTPRKYQKGKMKGLGCARSLSFNQIKHKIYA